MSVTARLQPPILQNKFLPNLNNLHQTPKILATCTCCVLQLESAFRCRTTSLSLLRHQMQNAKENAWRTAEARCLLSPHFPSDTIAEPRIYFWQNQEAPNMPRLSLAYPGGMSEYQLSMAPEHREIDVNHKPVLRLLCGAFEQKHPAM